MDYLIYRSTLYSLANNAVVRRPEIIVQAVGFQSPSSSDPFLSSIEAKIQLHIGTLPLDSPRILIDHASGTYDVQEGLSAEDVKQKASEILKDLAGSKK